MYIGFYYYMYAGKLCWNADLDRCYAYGEELDNGGIGEVKARRGGYTHRRRVPMRLISDALTAHVVGTVSFLRETVTT